MKFPYAKYDPSAVEATEYCIREDMCSDIADLEEMMLEKCKQIARLALDQKLTADELRAKLANVVADNLWGIDLKQFADAELVCEDEDEEYTDEDECDDCEQEPDDTFGDDYDS